MSKRNQNHVVDGEVVLVDRAKVPQAKPVIEVSHRQAELLRPKRPLSEKQQANLQRLIEQNKARAAAWKGQKVPEQLEEIPEDKVAIQVKPKRPYNRKVPHHFSKPVEIKPETEEEAEDDTESEAELPPPPVKKSRPGKSRKIVAPPTSDEDEESEVEPKPKRVTKKNAVPVRRRIVSDTSDFEDETDDDHHTQKYMAKAQARLEAVKKIEEQIRAKSNPYASRGLSAF
jgi:hypothetical protein